MRRGSCPNSTSSLSADLSAVLRPSMDIGASPGFQQRIINCLRLTLGSGRHHRNRPLRRLHRRTTRCSRGTSTTTTGSAVRQTSATQEATTRCSSTRTACRSGHIRRQECRASECGRDTVDASDPVRALWSVPEIYEYSNRFPHSLTSSNMNAPRAVWLPIACALAYVAAFGLAFSGVSWPYVDVYPATPGSGGMDLAAVRQVRVHERR